jgi:hypothetical protein
LSIAQALLIDLDAGTLLIGWDNIAQTLLIDWNAGFGL